MRFMGQKETAARAAGKALTAAPVVVGRGALLPAPQEVPAGAPLEMSLFKVSCIFMQELEGPARESKRGQALMRLSSWILLHMWRKSAFDPLVASTGTSLFTSALQPVFM